MEQGIEEMQMPFGAKDSELYEWEYTIAEGCEAKIENGKVIVRRKESKDEKIRSYLINFIELNREVNLPPDDADRMIAWLEQQGMHNKFRQAIQIGDQVTRNKDGVLVNLSQLKRVAKSADTEQKSEGRVDEDEIEYYMEKKFKPGDVVFYAASHPSYSGLYILGQPNDLHIGYDSANHAYNIALRNCTLANDEQRKQFHRTLCENGYVWDEGQFRIVTTTIKGCLYATDNYTDRERAFLCDGCKEDCALKPLKKSDQELTEFEKAVLDIIPDHRTHTDSVEEFARRNANRLLSISRKQFIEEACKFIYNYCNPELSKSATLEEIGRDKIIEDFRKALEKG